MGIASAEDGGGKGLLKAGLLCARSSGKGFNPG